ncbi:hypothetical protein [Microbacterium sp. T32]|uniref:hypothetical protein n=1 Tax=Microbacterium sp. T32 TaxID=1776083 RepID=UPI0007AB344C|nr:hypothetical protein [Microbacterium sp. T32]KZE39689.1 hypothetical protein AVW09_15600 [Microbacterium sp. T32]
MPKTPTPDLVALLATEGAGTDVQEARQEAKARASRSPELRLALAEHYRQIGDRAQAGRWGVVFPGWTRPREVAHMRLWLLGQATRGNFVRQSLRLAHDEAVPAVVADLTSPTYVERGPNDGSPAQGLGCVSMLIAVIGLIAGFLTLLWNTAHTLWNAFLSTPSPLTAELALAALITVIVSGGVLAAGLRLFDRPVELPDPAFATRRALELLDSRPQEGRVMLRALVRADGDPEARRALVEDARRRNRPAQAGRWGCPLPGVTTEAERDAYAASILSRGGNDPSSVLAERSHLRFDDPVPGDVPDVARRLGAAPWDPRSASHSPGIAWWAAAAPLPIGAAATAFAPASAHAIAVSSVIAVLAIWWGLCVRGAFSRKREPRERWAFAMGALALVWAVGGVLLAAAR